MRSRQLLKVAAPPLGGGVGEEGDPIPDEGAALCLQKARPLACEEEVEPAPAPGRLGPLKLPSRKLREFAGGEGAPQDLVCDPRVDDYGLPIGDGGEDVELRLPPVAVAGRTEEEFRPGTRSSRSLPGFGRWQLWASPPSATSAITENRLVLERNLPRTISPSIFSRAISSLCAASP